LDTRLQQVASFKRSMRVYKCDFRWNGHFPIHLFWFFVRVLQGKLDLKALMVTSLDGMARYQCAINAHSLCSRTKYRAGSPNADCIEMLSTSITRSHQFSTSGSSPRQSSK